MIRQVFSKLFRSDNSSHGLRASEQYNGQAQIYAIPTISSGFGPTRQQKNPSGNQNQMSSVPMSSSARDSYPSLSATNLNKLDAYAKFDDNNTRQIYIAPHCIRYSNSTLDETIYRIDEESLNEIAAEILESENAPPKLQIVLYNGNYYAINNSNLQIYKQLQLTGLITHVQADLISIEAIPYQLREYLLQTPSFLLDSFGQESLTDEEGRGDPQGDDLSSSSRSQRTNGSSACSGDHAGVDVEHEICNRDGCRNCDCPTLDGCECAPDVVYAEDMFDESNIFVDEIYEFGACENCVGSGDEEEEDEEGREIGDDGVQRFSGTGTGVDLGGLCEDTSKKLEIHLKPRKDSQLEVDLDQVVKSALSNEIIEMKNEENRRDPRFKEAASSSVSDEFSLLKLDTKQKELNEQLFVKKAKKMTKSHASKTSFTRPADTVQLEVQSLLVGESENL